MTSTASGQPAHVGERIGAYELVEKLEETASLIAFRGRDPLLGRRVVVRQALLSPGPDGDGARQALRGRVEQYRELARRHDRLVNVIEVIDDPRGLFVVSEAVEGDTLDARLAHGQPVAPLAVLRTLKAVALALQPLHDAGLTHRDLRPACLIVSDTAGVRLNDFGLAGMLADSETLAPAGVRYTSPELCRGGAGDPRSDLYSLGMIAYEMLVGRAAFDDVFSAVLRDTRQQAMRWVKWHASARNIAPQADEVNPAVPPVLAQIVARLMEKDPARRIASTRQLLETIERHFAGERPAPPPSPAPASVKPGAGVLPAKPVVSTGGDTAALPPRPRRPWGIAVAVAAVLLLVGGYFIYQSVSASRADQALVAAQEQALRDAEAAYKSGSFAEARELYEQVHAALPPSHRLAVIARAGGMRSDAHLLMQIGRFDEARAQLARVAATDVFSRDALRELGEEIDARQASAGAVEAIRAKLDAGDLDAARRAIVERRAVVMSDAERAQLEQLSVELEGLSAQRRIDAVLARAEDLVTSGDLDGAIAGLADAYEGLRDPRLQRRLDDLTARRRVGELLATGGAAEASGEWTAAIVAYTEAQQLSSDPAVLDRLANAKMQAAVAQGRDLFTAGDMSGAAAAFTRALGFGDSAEARGYLARMQAAGDARAQMQAGNEAYAAGEFSAASRHFAAALELSPGDEELAARLTDAQLKQHLSAGRNALARSDYDAARQAFEQARAIDPEAPGAAEGMAELAPLVSHAAALERGDTLLASGQYSDAKRAYAEALRVLDTPQARARADDAEYEHLLAQARSYLSALRYDAAEARLHSAARIHDTAVVRQLLDQVAKERGS